MCRYFLIRVIGPGRSLSTCEQTAERQLVVFLMGDNLHSAVNRKWDKTMRHLHDSFTAVGSVLFAWCDTSLHVFSM